jgi:hypothetical protein
MVSDPLIPPDWTCGRCGAVNPPDFGCCWICGAFEDGTDDPGDIPPGRTITDVAVNGNTL